MKKNESKSHLRPGNRVSYFTYEDLDVIPKVLEQFNKRKRKRKLLKEAKNKNGTNS